MLSVFVIVSCALLICSGPLVNGYTVAALSGSRGQDYSGGYRTTGGFVGMKDVQGDYSENPSSQRYSSIGSAGGGGGGGGGFSSTSGSDAGGYGDSAIVGSHLSGYRSANSGGNQASSSSYGSELGAQGGGSAELVGASYSTGGSSSAGGLSGYTSGGSSGSGASQNEGSSLSEYSESSLGGSGGYSLGLERGEYSSGASPRPGSSYASYSLGGPKTAAYTSSGPSHGGQGQSQGHGISSYASSPGISFSGGGYRPVSSSGSSASSYPSEISPHAGIASGSPNYASAQSLKGFLASMHGPSNYIPHGPHRGSSNHHPFASASNHLPGYSPRGPSAAYNFPANGPFPRGGGSPNGKIIIVKESAAGHHPPTHIYPGDHHSFSGAMFGSPSSGYKIRNLAASATSHGPPSFSNAYASSSNNYNSPSSSSSSHSNSLASSLFSFL